MSDLYPIQDIGGTIDSMPEIMGYIDDAASSVISGNVSTTLNVPTYKGEYVITPLAREDQLLETENRMLEENILVKEIPIYRVSDPENNGVVVCIG